MADLPDDLGRLEAIASQLRDRLARIEARIRRLKDEQWREYQKQRAAAMHAEQPRPRSPLPMAHKPNKD